VLLLARFDRLAERARETVEDTPTRLGAGVDPAHVQVVTDINALATATFVVEAVVEDQEVKAALLGQLGGAPRRRAPDGATGAAGPRRAGRVQGDRRGRRRASARRDSIN
jgi:hypothetical protein